MKYLLLLLPLFLGCATGQKTGGCFYNIKRTYPDGEVLIQTYKQSHSAPGLCVIIAKEKIFDNFKDEPPIPYTDYTIEYKENRR